MIHLIVIFLRSKLPHHPSLQNHGRWLLFCDFPSRQGNTRKLLSTWSAFTPACAGVFSQEGERFLRPASALRPALSPKLQSGKLSLTGNSHRTALASETARSGLLRGELGLSNQAIRTRRLIWNGRRGLWGGRMRPAPALLHLVRDIVGAMLMLMHCLWSTVLLQRRNPAFSMRSAL